jgi:hypothetical protein
LFSRHATGVTLLLDDAKNFVKPVALLKLDPLRMRRIYASPRKSFSTFAFTLSSILISGGQGRLKPSPGNFFVASKQSLLPMAISLVTWSSTSARKRNQLREFPVFSELSKPSHSVLSCPRLIGLDAAWRGAAALAERQPFPMWRNRRHPDFRMPPLVLASLFFVQLASVAHLPNAWHIWGSGSGSGMGRTNFHSALLRSAGTSVGGDPLQVHDV